MFLFQKLLTVIKEKEESDRKYKEMDAGMQKIRVYHNHLKEKRLVDCRLYMANESTLEETLKEAYQRLNLESIIPIERCRLVAYDSKTHNCERSFECRDQEDIGSIMAPLETKELLIETCEENGQFEVYVKGGIFVRV